MRLHNHSISSAQPHHRQFHTGVRHFCSRRIETPTEPETPVGELLCQQRRHHHQRLYGRANLHSQERDAHSHGQRCGVHLLDFCGRRLRTLRSEYRARLDHDYFHDWCQCRPAMAKFSVLQRTSELLCSTEWDSIRSLCRKRSTSRVPLHPVITFRGVVLSSHITGNDHWTSGPYWPNWIDWAKWPFRSHGPPWPFGIARQHI
jgi:hypothetical protein